MKLDTETQDVVREMRQKVEEAKSSLSSNRSRGKVLDALMQQKKTGRIPGILGRLVENRFITLPPLRRLFCLRRDTFFSFKSKLISRRPN